MSPSSTTALQRATEQAASLLADRQKISVALDAAKKAHAAAQAELDDATVALGNLEATAALADASAPPVDSKTARKRIATAHDAVELSASRLAGLGQRMKANSADIEAARAALSDARARWLQAELTNAETAFMEALKPIRVRAQQLNAAMGAMDAQSLIALRENLLRLHGVDVWALISSQPVDEATALMASRIAESKMLLHNLAAAIEQKASALVAA